MVVFPNFRRAFHRTNTEDASAMTTVEESKRDPVANDTIANTDDNELQADLPSEDLQSGVGDVEAMTLAWSRPMLITVFLKYVFLISCCWPSFVRDDVADLVRLEQHLAPLLCKCISKLDLFQSDPLCYECIRVSLAAKRYLCRCGFRKRGMLHPVSKDHGCLGPSRGLSIHGSCCNFGIGPYGGLQ